jgi:hypothetical protein
MWNIIFSAWPRPWWQCNPIRNLSWNLVEQVFGNTKTGLTEEILVREVCIVLWTFGTKHVWRRADLDESCARHRHLSFPHCARITRVWAINITARRTHEGVAAGDIVEECAVTMAQFSNGVVGTFLVNYNVASPIKIERRGFTWYHKILGLIAKGSKWCFKISSYIHVQVSRRAPKDNFYLRVKDNEVRDKTLP